MRMRVVFGLVVLGALVQVCTGQNTDQTQLEEFETTTNPVVTPAVDTTTFGVAIAMNEDGLVAVSEYYFVGVQQRGRVRIHEDVRPNWNEIAVVTSSNVAGTPNFGSSLAFSGDLLVVGAPGDTVGSAARAGSAFVFRRAPGTDTWNFEAKILRPTPLQDDSFASAVAVDGTNNVVAVGCAFCDVNGLGNAGGVFIYISPLGDGNWAFEQTLLRPTGSIVSARFGLSVFLSYPLLFIGSADSFGTTPSVGAVYAYRYLEDIGNGITPWQFVSPGGIGLFPPAGRRNGEGEFAHTLFYLNSTLFVGAPRATVNGILDVGAVYRYPVIETPNAITLNYGDPLVYEPVEPMQGIRFGASVAFNLVGPYLAISAEGDDMVNQRYGTLYLYRPKQVDLFTNAPVQLRVTLWAEDGLAGGLFGHQVIMGDDRVIVNAPQQGIGSVYQYDGPEMFPLGYPIFEPDGGIYLINTTFVINLRPFYPDEIIHYELNTGALPTLESPIFTQPFVFPQVTAVYELSAIAASDRFFSLARTRVYNLYVPAPGFYWTSPSYFVPEGESVTLLPCGTAQVYCPGTFEDPYRHEVDLGYYTTPRDAPPNVRSGQRPCERSFICIEGFRTGCNRLICWPQLVSATAEEGGPFEEGLGDGDMIRFVFDAPTNEVNVSSTEWIYQLLEVSEPIAEDMTGEWEDANTLVVTIHESQYGDPAFTAVNRLTFKVRKEGELRLQGNFTQASHDGSAITLGGTWGKVDPPPIIDRLIAIPSNADDHGYGPGTDDELLLIFDKDVPDFPVATRADIDAVLQFSPTLDDVEYVGEWLSYRELWIKFYDYDKKTSPLLGIDSWHRERFMVGRLQVRVREEAHLISRDGSSDTVLPIYRTIDEGSWGDTVDELILTLRNSTAFWIDFLGSNSPVSPDDIDFYLIQVSEDTPFPSWEGQEDPQFSLYRNITFPRNSTMDTNRERYRVMLSGLQVGSRYYVRAFVVFTDGTRGPALTSAPNSMSMAPPLFLKVERGIQVPTYGGDAVLKITNVGIGNQVVELFVSAELVNGTRPGAFPAQCTMLRDGEHIHCVVPPGVGYGYQWRLQIADATMDDSLPVPDQVTSYFPPLITGFLYDPIDDFGVPDDLLFGYVYEDGLQAAGHNTEGGDRIRIIGKNFGVVALNAVQQVTFYSEYWPDIVYEASGCAVTRDHMEITCFIPAGAGARLKWDVTIAGQSTSDLYSYYDSPVITEIYSAVGSNIMPTAGGEPLIARGSLFGPSGTDLKPYLACSPSDPPPFFTNEENYDPAAWALFDDVLGPVRFITNECFVSEEQVEIMCSSPPGIGRQLTCALHLLGLASQAFQQGLSYGDPVLTHISLIPIVTSSESQEGDFVLTTTVSAENIVGGSGGPLKLPTAGSDVPIGLFGDNFGAIIPGVAELFFDGVSFQFERIVDDQELNFKPPPGVGKNHTLQLRVNQVLSNILLVDYGPPVIDSFTLQTMQWHFPTPSFDLQAGLENGVRTDNDGRIFIPCVRFDGTNFGGSVITLDDLTVVVQDRPCNHMYAHSHTSLICCTEVRRGNVTIEVAAQKSNPKFLAVELLEPPPTITKITPEGGTTAGGVTVAIHGTGLRNAVVQLRGTHLTYNPARDITVGVSNLEAVTRYFGSPSEINGTLLYFWLPAGHGPTLFVTANQFSVLGQGMLASNEFPYPYGRPKISTVSPSRVYGPGGVLVITGSSFGTHGTVVFEGLRDGDQRVTGQPYNISMIPIAERTFPATCDPVLLWSHERIECFVLPNRSPSGPLHVNVGWASTATTFPGLLFTTEVETYSDYFTRSHYESVGIMAEVYRPVPDVISAVGSVHMSFISALVICVAALLRMRH